MRIRGADCAQGAHPRRYIGTHSSNSVDPIDGSRRYKLVGFLHFSPNYPAIRVAQTTFVQ